MDKLSYALGLGIGRQLSQMGAENLNIDDFAQAIKDMLEGKEPQVADQEAQMIVTEFSSSRRLSSAKPQPRSIRRTRTRARLGSQTRLLRRA